MGIYGGVYGDWYRKLTELMAVYICFFFKSIISIRPMGISCWLRGYGGSIWYGELALEYDQL